MSARALRQSFFVLAAWALAASAHASYGQMRLDGLGLLLVWGLVVTYGVVVDIALFARIFRYRTAAVIGSVVALVVVLLFLLLVASPVERDGFFKGAPGGSELVQLVVTSVVFLPFIVIAPYAQYLSMRDSLRWPRWITAWMILQLALVPGFLVLLGTEYYFWQQEFKAGQSEGSQVKAGGLSRILERAEQKHERIWGTGWTYPWQETRRAGSYVRTSAWISGLAKSMDTSAPITASEPLSAPDRGALRTLIAGHFGFYPHPHTRAKLLWDALEPGAFSKQLAPIGLTEIGVVDEEVIPVLLDLIEKHSGERLCPGGRMVDADRALLNALVAKKGLVWNKEKRVDEMRPEWAGFPQRIERLCRGPA